MEPESVDDVAVALVAIPSVNPDLEPGGAGESATADWCADWLRRRGFTIERVGSPARPSVIARGGRAGHGRVLMLNGHTDTVGLAESTTVFSADAQPTIADGRLYGRGAYDMKAALAAMLVAAASAVHAGIEGEVVLTLVADDEFGSTGTEQVLRLVRADGAVVAEPTGGCVVLAHRGFAWFAIELTGFAAHGSLPEQGVDAIAAAGILMTEFGLLARRLRERGAHPLLQPGTVRVATISGGSDAATVADRCRLVVERRFLPGERIDDVEAELAALVEHVTQRTPGLRAEVRRMVARAAFEADPEALITRAVLEAVRRTDGRAAEVRGEPFWTDAGLIAEAGIPVLLVGPDGDGLHADVEWVDLASAERLRTILEHTIHSFCC